MTYLLASIVLYLLACKIFSTQDNVRDHPSIPPRIYDMESDQKPK